MKIAIIGHGAIASFVTQHLAKAGVPVTGVICRPGREDAARAALGKNIATATEITALPFKPDLLLDCAGHEALRAFGAMALGAGIDILTVSVGALADTKLHDHLSLAARKGGAQLQLASGAVGALDALSAAAIGTLTSVTYTGRKPPMGWIGSPADKLIDLRAMGAEPVTHFSGTARDAAVSYPKNANVAASVALAGMGFDQTKVTLIADPNISVNIHEITAKGDFGSFTFHIEGKALASNPKSSALTAMNVVSETLKRHALIRN